jgi:SAM-dependent methyltransferase
MTRRVVGLALPLVLALLAGACEAGKRPAAAAASQGADPEAQPSAIIARSVDLFQTLDSGDATRLDEFLASGFMRAENLRFADREQWLRAVAARGEKLQPGMVERSWSDQKVRFFGRTAIFTGFASIKLAREAGSEPVASDRFVTLVWVWEDGRWRLAHLQSQDAGIDAERQQWNEFFRTSMNFNAQPNRLLVETARTRTPGAALDVGTGQGRNALYLAAQGWQVTGIDISDEGIRQAQEAARREGLSFETLVANADTWEWGTARWDLICLIYMGRHDPWMPQIRQSLKKGGIVVIEFFHLDSVAGMNVAGFRSGELPAMFKDGFKVLRYEEVEDVADFGLQKVKLVRFVAEKL